MKSPMEYLLKEKISHFVKLNLVVVSFCVCVFFNRYTQALKILPRIDGVHISRLSADLRVKVSWERCISI